MAKQSSAKIIEEMLKELTNCRKKLEKLQTGIDDRGLSFDIDRTYDGLREAEEQLNKYKETLTEESN
jgi:hypothetical protein